MSEVRHLKRLKLAAVAPKEHPLAFRAKTGSHWGKKKVISRLNAK